ncbi:MAG: hypothetical protein HZB26_07110 [Candidatus Hydrogenedentes bacterium]|nr:hypothetical protein [Candidatus Hydrogenedentota bacterium]
MNSRQRLLDTLSFRRGCPPPRFEAEFSDELVKMWTQQGHLRGESPEEFLGLDSRETLPVEWGKLHDGTRVVMDEDDLAPFRRAYDPSDRRRLSVDWPELVAVFQDHTSILWDSPWDEGFFQVLGIRDAESFSQALTMACEKPCLAEAQMEHYATFLETLIDEVFSKIAIDYAVFYEPIASNSAPVISPAMYAHFVQSALRRIVDRLARYGVRHFFIWTAGQVRPLVPVWLEAGINGFMITQAGAAGISYRALRREFGASIRFFGGIDWRTVMDGPRAVESFLDSEARPLLEQGGYVPHLDDRVREYVSFEAYCAYRTRLDALIAEGH